MAKLTIIAALLAALIAVASATTFTTVVTTTTTSNDDNPREEETCEQQIRQHRMQHCQQWMMQMGGRSYETPFLRSAVANPRVQEEHLEECCNELGRIPSKCRCEAINDMVMKQQQEYGIEEQMKEMMRRKAESLPRMCKWKSPTQCSIRTLYF